VKNVIARTTQQAEAAVGLGSPVEPQDFVRRQRGGAHVEAAARRDIAVGGDDVVAEAGCADRPSERRGMAGEQGQNLDAAERGKVATVRRDAARSAVVDVERLRYFLAKVLPSGTQVVAEAGGWSVFIPGVPVSADAATFDEAITEMVDALREYVADWHARLLDAQNHRDNWGLVQLISLSDDDQLRDWLVGTR